MTARSVAVITVSDRTARGETVDRSGPIAVELLDAAGWDVIRTQVVPDEISDIAGAVVEACDEGCALVVTTGGTGIAVRDVTPEAIRTVLEREVPGIAEAMRAATFGSLPAGMLSRQIAGTRGRSLVVALPGSTGGVRDGMVVVLSVAEHAIALLGGDTEHSG